jgi:DNA-binding HxlR family transcriptional regulator
MQSDDHLRDVQSVMMIMSRIGHGVATAIETTAGPELNGNGPIAVLFALDLEGPKRPTELQEITGLTSGGVSKLLDRMEALGLVTREFGAIAEDRRGALVRLTPRGRRTSRKIGNAVGDALAELRVQIKELGRLVEP